MFFEWFLDVSNRSELGFAMFCNLWLIVKLFWGSIVLFYRLFLVFSVCFSLSLSLALFVLDDLFCVFSYA